MIRLIVCSNENGNKEIVQFTEDFDAPASDFCDSDCTVDLDERLDILLPSTFPLDYTLVRRG